MVLQNIQTLWLSVFHLLFTLVQDVLDLKLILDTWDAKTDVLRVAITSLLLLLLVYILLSIFNVFGGVEAIVLFVCISHTHNWIPFCGVSWALTLVVAFNFAFKEIHIFLFINLRLIWWSVKWTLAALLYIYISWFVGNDCRLVWSIVKWHLILYLVWLQFQIIIYVAVWFLPLVFVVFDLVCFILFIRWNVKAKKVRMWSEFDTSVPYHTRCEIDFSTLSI